MRGPRHKRYLMLTSEGSIDDETRKELTRRMAKISPVLAKKAVWFDRALIVKTDNVDISIVRQALEELVVGPVTLRSALTSGSIGKLKKRSRGRQAEMVKFFSPEYFAQIQDTLANDPKWQEGTRSVKTSIRLTSTGQQASTYLLKVEEGKTTIAPSEPTTQAEFSFEGTYDTWTKLAKGEVEFQSAVLKGLLKFKGSITKILAYRDRFVRIAEVMRSAQVEF